ncbi:methionine adenosyltransferase [Alistipes putredinis]|uniref:methionine adenosyltransferase n=1 Tax=Alistipes putredinis TaxID=28117 RepID=UPI003A885801
MKDYIFTSESITEGHPDKICDKIADSILDEALRQDPYSNMAVEATIKDDFVLIYGEADTKAHIDYAQIAKDVIRKIGYEEEYTVMIRVNKQSSEIHHAVNHADHVIGAGDQGIMFGYACNETREYMPATLILSHVILKELAVIRREGQVMTYLRPDAKSQVTIEYDEQTHRPLRVHTIVVSTQHDDFIPTSKGVTEKMAEKRMQEKIREDVRTILIPRVKARLERAKDKLARLIGDDYILHVNPTGKFVIGGPHGDTGLTGRKIIVDSYGGRGAHGGGAFSGKDSSKVDRSAAYAARYIAKNMVAAGIADEILVELSYAIGIAEPISVFVDTHGAVCSRNPKLADMTDGEIARRIAKLFDLRPAAIVKKFGLKNPIFEATASYGHFGNRPYTRKEKVWEDGREVEREIEFFGWEKLDAVDLIKQEFGL